MPVDAVLFTLFSTCLLSLIIIGSAIAFNILLFISNISIYISYMFIECIMRKLIRGERLLPTRFSLDRARIFINVISFAYLVVDAVFIFFPSVLNPELVAINWACLTFGFSVIFSIVYYFLYGKQHYVEPTEHARKMDWLIGTGLSCNSHTLTIEDTIKRM
jgi:choline transport protein